jgi:hypothetical protein
MGLSAQHAPTLVFAQRTNRSRGANHSSLRGASDGRFRCVSFLQFASTRRAQERIARKKMKKIKIFFGSASASLSRLFLLQPNRADTFTDFDIDAWFTLRRTIAPTRITARPSAHRRSPRLQISSPAIVKSNRRSAVAYARFRSGEHLVMCVFSRIFRCFLRVPIPLNRSRWKAGTAIERRSARRRLVPRRGSTTFHVIGATTWRDPFTIPRNIMRRTQNGRSKAAFDAAA